MSRSIKIFWCARTQCCTWRSRPAAQPRTGQKSPNHNPRESHLQHEHLFPEALRNASMLTEAPHYRHTRTHVNSDGRKPALRKTSIRRLFKKEVRFRDLKDVPQTDANTVIPIDQPVIAELAGLCLEEQCGEVFELETRENISELEQPLPSYEDRWPAGHLSLYLSSDQPSLTLPHDVPSPISPVMLMSSGTASAIPFLVTDQEPITMPNLGPTYTVGSVWDMPPAYSVADSWVPPPFVFSRTLLKRSLPVISEERSKLLSLASAQGAPRSTSRTMRHSKSQQVRRSVAARKDARRGVVKKGDTVRRATKGPCYIPQAFTASAWHLSPDGNDQPVASENDACNACVDNQLLQRTTQPRADNTEATLLRSVTTPSLSIHRDDAQTIPKRSISVPLNPIAVKHSRFSDCVVPALNGVSVFYSSKTQCIIALPGSGNLVQLTNSQKIRRCTSHRPAAPKIWRPTRILSTSSQFSFTSRSYLSSDLDTVVDQSPSRNGSIFSSSYLPGEIESTIKQIPFENILRSASLDNPAFYRSARELLNVRGQLKERVQPRHKFQGGKFCASGAGSILRAAYPEVKCDRCTRVFRGPDRKVKVARHRRKVHGSRAKSVCRKLSQVRSSGRRFRSGLNVSELGKGGGHETEPRG